jgi:Fe-Mn family superoxide dismutase
MLKKGFLSLMLCSVLSVSAYANFKQAPLPYKSDALEPAIDQKTMEIHYGKHHKAYVDNLNAQIKTYPELDKLTLNKFKNKFLNTMLQLETMVVVILTMHLLGKFSTDQ